MRILVPVAVILLVSGAAAIAGGDSFSEPGDGASEGPRRSLYDRIYAHYAHLGRDVEEEFRDGPCKVERHWERDGDFEEHISCEGPGH